MALIAEDLVKKLGSFTESTEPGQAMTDFWGVIKEYIEENAEPTYAWVATLPPPVSTPDPIISFTGKIQPTGELVLPGLSGASDAAAALGILATAMNTSMMTWIIEPPEGFVLTPILVIPSIVLTPSMTSDRNLALKHLAEEIIAGIKGPHATPATSGIHGPFSGNGALVGIS